MVSEIQTSSRFLGADREYMHIVRQEVAPMTFWIYIQIKQSYNTLLHHE